MSNALKTILMSFVTGLESIRLVNDRRATEKHEVAGIVLVGSSCAGKSVIVDAIRKSEKLVDYGVEVPIRFVTRPMRMGDNTIENRHLSNQEFESLVQAGEIGLHWVRKMEGDREERYGFASVTNGSLPVYSGNNAFYNNATSVQSAAHVNQLLVIGIYAPDSVRRNRLLVRSPDLLHERPEEVLYRLGDSSENILRHSDYVVDNFGKNEGVAVEEVITLMQRIAEMNRATEWEYE